jgi:HD superfamily phosphodiesterase
MKRVHSILEDEAFTNIMKMIEEKEVDRLFCKHNYDHVLSVARIAYILYLEEYVNSEKTQNTEELRYMKELIYATALLHDIGRYSVYEEHMNHREAGPIVARPILEAAGFTEKEIETISYAIEKHGDYPDEPNSLAGMLYRADKMSRNCFDCKAEKDCNWSEEKKNKLIKY